MKETRDAIPTARVMLKTEKIGNSVLLRKVTPSELMFLVADNHQNAGGDPVLSLSLEKKLIKGEVVKVDATGAKELDAEGNEMMVPGMVESDEELVYKLTPKQEINRLAQKYGKRITKFFPGPMPTLPKTFEEAREAGIGSTTPSERLLEVGG